VHPVWILFLQLLLGQCLSGPEVGGLARAVAGGAAGFLVHSQRRHRIWAMLALGLGLLLGGRLSAELRRVRAWDGWEGDATVVLREATRKGRAAAWIQAPGKSTVPVILSRCGSAPAGCRGRMRLRTWLPPARRNPDDVDRWRAFLSRPPLLRGRMLESPGWSQCLRPGPEPVRERWRKVFRSRLEPFLGASTPIWSALLLGDRRGLDPASRKRFQRLGLAHLLALSGLHVGLIALLLLRLPRPGRRGSELWILPVLSVWAFAAGLSPSLVRAVVMAGWLLTGRSLGRSVRAVDALAAAGVVELLVRPASVTALGWWLSYAATLALLRVGRILPRHRLLAAATAVLVAPLGTLPWVLGSFGRLPWAAPLWNLLLGGVFSLWMALGAVLVLIALVLPPLAGASCFLLAAISHGFGWILRLVTRLDPGALGHPGIGGAAWCAALVAVGLVLVPDLPGRFRARLALALLLVAVVHRGAVFPPEATWWSLDVGQGDGGVLRVRGGGVLVVDTGNGSFHGTTERVIVPFLERRNLSGVDLLITHGHRDHFGGAVAVLESGRVARLHLAAVERGRKWTRPLLRAAREHGVAIDWMARGDTLRLADWRLACLWPPTAARGETTNDRSLVLRGGPPGRQMLWAGDLEAPAERELIARGDPLSVAVLKVAHHGSQTGTEESLLQKMPGGWALISCGAVNRYGHPHTVTLKALRAHGWRILRTDRRGAVGVSWSGTRVRGHWVRAGGETPPP